MNESLAKSIDAQLPQTQCTRCGYPDCASYAAAIAAREAAINRCPPGGAATIVRLAGLLGVEPVGLDREFGTEAPRKVAFVDESWCIGCTLCIAACPVDAIVGAAKRMHTIIESLCTGCELCVAPCPVECIHLQVAQTGPSEPSRWLLEQAAAAKARYLARAGRLAAAALKSVAEGADAQEQADTATDAMNQRKRLIREAVARARSRRQEQAS